jgi:hypothetical protein
MDLLNLGKKEQRRLDGMRGVSGDTGKTRVTARELYSLIQKQHFRCALSGRNLEPDSAALDHIIAISSGGSHCMENVQVLHKEVNQAKGTMTQQEFISMCREVAALHG